MALLAFAASSLTTIEPEACRAPKAALPSRDQPSPAEKIALAGCDSEALYYGIGVKVDFARARKCAYVERAAARRNAGLISGSAVLMMLYANGEGVPRNLALATRFACEADSAPAERAGRLDTISAIGAGASTHLDVCDDRSSGMLDGFCAGRDARRAAVVRDARRAELVARLPAKPARALATAAKQFFDARTRLEVDLSGTARAEFQVEEEERLEDALQVGLELLAARRAPPTPAAQLQTVDGELNRTYAALMKSPGADWGTVTSEGIRKTEVRWLAYRDAFVALATGAVPDVPADAWRAWLTASRLEQLKEFAGSE